MSRSRLLIAAVLAVALLGGLLPACAPAAQPQPVALAHLHDMPAEVQAAPASVQDAYRFAHANPDLASQLPCYCGCGPIGHVSLYDCYWQAPAADGSITFDSHALGCKICVDIALDAIRLAGEGKSPGQIKSFVDTAYGRYGASNMP
jgi:hypothetical protein